MQGLVVADSHAGHLLGLTPPQYQREDVKPVARPFWDWVLDTVKSFGPMQVGYHLAESIEGPGKKSTLGLATTDMEEQATWAAETWIEVSELAGIREWYMVEGTPYHTDSGQQVERQVARQMRAAGLRVVIMPSLRVKQDHLTLNLRHTIGRSQTPYGQATMVSKEKVRAVLMQLLKDGTKDDLVLRAHVHLFEEVRNQVGWAASLPALKLDSQKFADPIGRQVSGWGYDVGIACLRTENGGATLDVRTYEQPYELTGGKVYVAGNQSAQKPSRKTR